VPRWYLPSKGTAYINFDANLVSTSRRMRIYVVIRSHIGECSLACSELLEVTTPELAEALVMRHVVSHTGREGFNGGLGLPRGA
jgi:hypothetical protein